MNYPIFSEQRRGGTPHCYKGSLPLAHVNLSLWPAQGFVGRIGDLGEFASSSDPSVHPLGLIDFGMSLLHVLDDCDDVDAVELGFEGQRFNAQYLAVDLPRGVVLSFSPVRRPCHIGLSQEL